MSERAPKKGARPKKCAECGGEMFLGPSTLGPIRTGGSGFGV